TLYSEAHGQDEDLVPFLNRNVIAPGLHLRHFQDDLGAALLDKDGLVIVLVIGKKDCRNRVFPQIFAGQSNAVVDLPCRRRNGGYFRGILSADSRSEAKQEKCRDEADLNK